MSKYRIRIVKTALGAKAVQVVWYQKNTTKIAKHIGSAKNADDLKMLRGREEQYIEEHNPQLSFFEQTVHQIVAFEDIEATSVNHQFAREMLMKLAEQCGLGFLDTLYRDLAIMRMIEPCSKLRSIKLLEQYFGVTYTRYLYERLPKLLDKRAEIEGTAVETAKRIDHAFMLLLYDVTTLYFETHKADNDLQARGFSKDDKSKQPQMVWTFGDKARISTHTRSF